MIRLGLRLAVSGGREAVVRLIILAAAVGLGVGLLLTVISAVNAVSVQNDRYAWLDTGAPAASGAGALGGATSRDLLWTLITTDLFNGQGIYRADVAAAGPASPVPPGIPRAPGPGQYYISPALAALLRSTPTDELADRYPGHQAGLIGEAGLPSPDSLVIIVGRSAAQMSHLPGAAKLTSFNTTPPSGCGIHSTCVIRGGLTPSGIDLVLSVVALALLMPVLIFIGTATRLSAARREQRFAAMRLVGATPRQTSVIAAVESAVAGIVIGFGLFFVLRIPLAAIPFTGQSFFPAELSLSLPDILAVAVGVPAVSALAARLALRRVNISPLGVSRRVTPGSLRAWRVLSLLAGLAELWFVVVHGKPGSPGGKVLVYVPGFALIMIGLILAGPWLTMAGARVMARRASRPGTLIAARRLADDPRAAFRAVSGVVLALFIFTVAAALLATQDTKHFTLKGRRGGQQQPPRRVLDRQRGQPWKPGGSGIRAAPSRNGAGPAPADLRRPGHRRVPGRPAAAGPGLAGRAGVVRPARERSGHRPVSGGSCHGGGPRSTRGISATPTFSASRSTARPANDLPVTRRQS